MSQKHAAYDDLGHITGYYDEDMGSIPAQSIPITDEQWNDCLEHQGKRKVQGGAIVPCASYNSKPYVSQ